MAATYTYKEVKALIKKISGQEHIITTPRVFIEMLGDHLVALFLGQAIYWSDRTTDPDGWFYHTDEEWHHELAISRFQVKRCSDALAPYGLSTKVKKVKGAPRTHYLLDFDIFIPKLMAHLDLQETYKSRNSQIDLQETYTSDLQETYTSLKEQRISKNTTTRSAPSGAGGGGAAQQETETERYLREIGVNSQSVLVKLRNIPLATAQAAYQSLDGATSIKHKAAVVVRMLADGWQPSPSSAGPLPPRQTPPYLDPDRATWSEEEYQRRMDAYSAGQRYHGGAV